MKRCAVAVAGLVLAMAACGGGDGARDPGGPDAVDEPQGDLAVPETQDGTADVPPEAVADTLPDVEPDAADGVEDAVGDAPDALPADAAWAGSDPFPVDGTFYALHPAAFARISRYATHVSGPVDARPDIGHRGSFGTGNGRVFGFVGLADPLNTLHSLVGPTYERRPNFFGDYAIRLARPQDSTPPDFDEEWAGRSLSAPVVLTRGRLGDLELDTIDLGPPGGAGLPATCFVRGLLVRNRAATESPAVTVVVAANNDLLLAQDGVLIEGGPAKDGVRRTVTTVFASVEGRAARAEGQALALDVGPLAAGAEVLRVLAHCTGEETTAGAGRGTVPAAGAPGVAETLWALAYPETELAVALDDAAQEYAAWEGGLVQVDVPDPMVADFLDGMKMTLKAQTAATGATCPMSNYTRTWARDNIGPVMAMLALGGIEDVEAMLDYVDAAIRYGGDLSNSYDADLDVANAPAAPDWATKGPLAARVAAETPSYMVTMYGLHQRYTGDLSRAVERWGLLRRCMYDVGWGVDRLLPFTGDETYRAAMNAAANIDLEVAHHDLSWSANSAFLWLGAAREFARLADLQGQVDQREEIRALADEVATKSLPYYRLEDGCWSAFVWRSTLEKAPPFEDVALQEIWSGYKDGDDAGAQQALDCLVTRLGRAPGEIVSPLGETWQGALLNAWEGVYTGMLPGYVLAVLNDAGHPQAPDAFAAVRKSLDTSGNLQEYMIFDDHSGFSVAYDPVGGLGDYTAKFRPWEGGIVAEAVMRHLLDRKSVV